MVKTIYCPVKGKVQEISPIRGIDAAILHHIACHVLDVVAERATKRPIEEPSDSEVGVQAFEDFRKALAEGHIWEGPIGI